MVKALNSNGLRVVMDVVYNHVAASGQDDHSVLDKVVPGYYLRYDTNGTLANSSCCSDTATEYDMMEKLMIDTAVRFASAYKVDGFRFDLMNLHTRRNMLNLKTAVQAVDPTIYVYGEGWDFGSALSKGLTTCPDCYARQTNMTGTGIGTFNDRIRDASHGGYSADPLQIRHQGFINGLSYDWNGYLYSNRTQGDLWGETAPPAHRAGRQRRRLHRRPAGDDQLRREARQRDPLRPERLQAAQRRERRPCHGHGRPRAQPEHGRQHRRPGAGHPVLPDGPGHPALQVAGSQQLRLRRLVQQGVLGHAAATTSAWACRRPGTTARRWIIMDPLLANTALDPAAADMNAAAAHLREILRIRKSSPLFRLTTEADANARVSFYNTDNAKDGLIVMALSDVPAPDLDASYETILVFFNANKIQQTFTIAGANAFSLHPLQADATDADAVVQTAGFNDATDTFTDPGAHHGGLRLDAGAHATPAGQHPGLGGQAVAARRRRQPGRPGRLRPGRLRHLRAGLRAGLDRVRPAPTPTSPARCTGANTAPPGATWR